MKNNSSGISDKISKILFVLSILSLFYFIGMVTRHLELFPYPAIYNAYNNAKKIIKGEEGMKKKFYLPTTLTQTVTTYDADQTYNGLTLITTLTKDKTLAARVIDMEGNIVHEWKIDWFDIWPDCDHLSEEEKPKSHPGTNIHGAVILKSGDLVFNFEDHGLVRMNICGDVIWRLPYRTHHSIFLDEEENLWIPGLIDHLTSPADFPYLTNIVEPSIVKVSLDGEILQEIRILDLVKKNDLQGLLVMSSLINDETKTSGDILHLNDVEIFPHSMPSGVFKPGDMMISLRNINAVMVFDAQDSIKFLSIGRCVRQHDPDFVDGNTISIFDNNNLGSYESDYQSRILVESALTGESYNYFSGDEQKGFYTKTMGKHQWLPNGNLLVTEAHFGRAFEINKKGRIVWEYHNIVEKGYVIFIGEATRLAPNFTAEFFKEKIAECSK